MNIALVSCVKLKKDYPCVAKEMYSVSTLFKKAVEYIESCNYDDWIILSAKYGLVQKYQVIEPYDETLNSMRVNERRSWAKDVADVLGKLSVNEFEIYAGAKYREFLIPLLEGNGAVCKVPLMGLGIGQQLKFYNNNKKR